ncbi:hypothetical protein [Actinoplanes sp. NPDC051851]|uniref:hypothetical protein n=1 Tax=Actinoplanes sp. NPDC051851 TaxID=3154753 RepID=UPI003448B893
MTADSEGGSATVRRGPAVASLVIVAGCAVGAAAFGVDYASGLSAKILTAATSSGFAWGLMALLAGYANARRAVIAASAGAGSLLAATGTYYTLILFVSQRWRVGTTESGSSGAMDGLMSVARTASFWVVGSLLAGVVFGLLGRLIRHASPRRSAVLIGGLFALLSAQGWNNLAFHRIWLTMDEFGVGVLVYAVSIVVFSALAAALLITLTNGWRHLVLTAAVAIAGSAVCMLLWQVAERIRESAVV